jgi:myo-inositol 2-dehydrogenase/D-chiro-inositol 1-dehydrogenase
MPQTSGPSRVPREPLRLGIAGLGTVAQTVYLPLLARRRSWFQISAVCDTSPSVLDGVAGVLRLPTSARHLRLEDMMSANLDAALLLTPGSHGAPAQTILDAGLFVLCEKPLAFTTAEADALAPADRLQLGYMKVFDPAVEQARKASGSLGELRSAEVTVLHPSIPRQLAHLGPLMRPALGELFASDDEPLRRALGPSAKELGALYSNVLLGSIVHELSVLDALVGGLDTIDTARTWPDDAFPPSVAVEGPLRDGARASIRWHFLAERPAYREEVALHFADGTIRLVFPSPFWLDAPTTLSITERDEDNGEQVTIGRSPQEAFERQLLAFHDLVTSKGVPHIGVREGRRHIELCQQAIALVAVARGLELGGEAGTW